MKCWCVKKCDKYYPSTHNTPFNDFNFFFLSQDLKSSNNAISIHHILTFNINTNSAAPFFTALKMTNWGKGEKGDLDSWSRVWFGVRFEGNALRKVFNLLLISSSLLSACPLLLQKILKAERSRETLKTIIHILHILIPSVEPTLIRTGYLPNWA